MSAEVVTVLEQARELISDPARWTRGERARDKSQRSVKSTSDEAVCWCALGALSNVTASDHGLYSNAIWALRKTLRVITHDSFISDYNDTRTHAEVLALFDSAIQTQKTKGDPSANGN